MLHFKCNCKKWNFALLRRENEADVINSVHPFIFLKVTHKLFYTFLSRKYATPALNKPLMIKTGTSTTNDVYKRR